MESAESALHRLHPDRHPTQDHRSDTIDNMLTTAIIERLIREGFIALPNGAASMSDDGKIELLKRRKLLEMKRRLLIERAEAMKAEEEEQAKTREPAPKPPSTNDILNTVFINRAWEVWNTAAAQYPQVIPQIGTSLASLIQAGKLTGKVTGEQLYWFFRRIGLRVRLKTKIRIYESGELKTIADKLRNK